MYPTKESNHEISYSSLYTSVWWLYVLYTCYRFPRIINRTLGRYWCNQLCNDFSLHFHYKNHYMEKVQYENFGWPRHCISKHQRVRTKGSAAQKHCGDSHSRSPPSVSTLASDSVRLWHWSISRDPVVQSCFGHFSDF